MSTLASRLVLAASVALTTLVLAGCDKCGHRIDFVAPSIQHACGDNSQQR